MWLSLGRLGRSPVRRGPDGKRIVVASYAGGSPQQEAGHVNFLENFIDELQRKMPLNGN
jgi:hypothetical protein